MGASYKTCTRSLPTCLLTLAAALLAGTSASGADAGSKPPLEVAGKPQARLILGEPAPEILATTLEGRQIALAGLRIPKEEGGKPRLIVLQFGSITEPVFRSRVGAVERLAAKYPQGVHFVVVYQQEAHPADSDHALEFNQKEGFDIADPATVIERQTLARQAAERLKIKNQTVIVDAWNNTTALRYGSYPNMTFIIDAKGILQAGYPWMDTAKVGAALDALIAGRALSADLKGSVKPSAAAPLDVPAAAVNMAGGRGPAAVAQILDRVSMTEPQRQKLLPALGRYFADLQSFRQARPGAPARAARPAPVPGATTRPGAAVPPPPDEPPVTLEQLRASADALKALIKDTLNEEDATRLLNALEQTQAQRLFAAPR